MHIQYANKSCGVEPSVLIGLLHAVGLTMDGADEDILQDDDADAWSFTVDKRV